LCGNCQLSGTPDHCEYSSQKSGTAATRTGSTSIQCLTCRTTGYDDEETPLASAVADRRSFPAGNDASRLKGKLDEYADHNRRWSKRKKTNTKPSRSRPKVMNASGRSSSSLRPVSSTHSGYSSYDTSSPPISVLPRDSLPSSSSRMSGYLTQSLSLIKTNRGSSGVYL
jgi:hypothetical protein